MTEMPLRSIPVQVLHGFGRNIPDRATIFMDFVAQQLASLGAVA
jgi:hypothetical protein